MRINYVLVDFENVQPKDMGLLKEAPFLVKIFLGPNQSKIPIASATALQPLGEKVEFIILESAGNNALDFHIAYFIGVLSATEPTAFFHVISKDKGFDSLLKYLKRKKKILAQRSICIADIPYFKKGLPDTPEAQVDMAIEHLIGRKASKPASKKTLLSTLDVFFKKQLSEQELSVLIVELCLRGFVHVEGTKVSYRLQGEV